MKKINKIYSVQIHEYNGNIKSNNEFCYLTNIIESFNNLYTLEDAINIGKRTIWDYCYNEICKDLEIEDLPEDITKDQFELFISDKLKENKSYAIIVEIISGSRIRFDTSVELMEYFNSNIKNISNNELYDFLLSLVASQSITYDYNGNYICSNIWEQCPILENGYSSKIDFNENDCLKGIYTFEYDY